MQCYRKPPFRMNACSHNGCSNTVTTFCAPVTCSAAAPLPLTRTRVASFFAYIISSMRDPCLGRIFKLRLFRLRWIFPPVHVFLKSPLLLLLQIVCSPCRCPSEKPPCSACIIPFPLQRLHRFCTQAKKMSWLCLTPQSRSFAFLPKLFLGCTGHNESPRSSGYPDGRGL